MTLASNGVILCDPGQVMTRGTGKPIIPTIRDRCASPLVIVQHG